MLETQNEIDQRYYSRWEIAAAREQTADGLGFIVAILLATVVDLKFDSWMWDIVAFFAGWWFSVLGRSADTKKAWASYENRPTLPKYHEDE